MTTCPKCRSEVSPQATYCSMCGACLERVVPPELPIPEVEVPLSESETRERQAHLHTAIVVAYQLRRVACFRNHVWPDRRTILDGMRHLLADPEGCGSRYHHPAACRAVDAVEGQKS